MNIRYLIALLPAVAFAEGVPPKPAPVPVSVSGAVAGAVADATASPVVIATPSASSVATQSQISSSSASSGATSGGNTQQTSFRAPQNAPAVATVPAPIVGCGASASGGGSNTGGAAILGLSWVTAECHGLSLANAYLAIGDRRAACDVLNTQKAAKRAAKRGARLPDCETLTVPPSEVVRLIDTPPDLSGYVRKEDLREVADRITRQMVAK